MENEHTDPTMSSAPKEQQPPTQAPKKEGGAGPIIGIIIIIILLGFGGVYYFTTGVDQIQHDVMEEMTPEEEAEALRAQGSSTDLSDIEADLEATDFSGLDDASLDFDSELQAQ